MTSKKEHLVTALQVLTKAQLKKMVEALQDEEGAPPAAEKPAMVDGLAGFLFPPKKGRGKKRALEVTAQAESASED